MKTFALVSLAFLVFAGALSYSQPMLFNKLLLDTTFLGFKLYYQFAAPPSPAGYSAEAAALDSLFLAHPWLPTASNFPKQFREAAEVIQVFVPLESDTRVNPEQIPVGKLADSQQQQQKGTRKFIDANWIDIRGVHSPVSLSHVMYIHGGAFVAGSITAANGFISKVVHGIHGRGLVVDYALVPEHPIEQALEDCIAAYQFLLSKSVSPSQIAIIGDSAGGNLATLTVHALIKRGIAVPAALVLLSPFADFTLASDSYKNNGPTDAMLSLPLFEFLMPILTRNGSQEVIKNFSPALFPASEFRGFPPTLIAASATERLADDSSTLAKLMKQAGVSVNLILEPHLPHIYPYFADYIPQARTDLDTIINFIRQRAQK